ncbi:hypothetical protein MRX96_011226 [Rhipicephalus microplus]
MRRTRWARRVFEYLSATCMRTDWTRRLYQLEKKYGFFAEASPIETAAKLDEDGSSDNGGGGRYAVAATKRRLTEWWATIRRT